MLVDCGWNIAIRIIFTRFTLHASLFFESRLAHLFPREPTSRWTKDGRQQTDFRNPTRHVRCTPHPTSLRPLVSLLHPKRHYEHILSTCRFESVREIASQSKLCPLRFPKRYETTIRRTVLPKASEPRPCTR